MNEPRWAAARERALRKVGKIRADARDAAKSADWKVAVAAWLKVQTETSNRWAATALNLGEPKAASRNLTAFFRSASERNQWW